MRFQSNIIFSNIFSFAIIILIITSVSVAPPIDLNKEGEEDSISGNTILSDTKLSTQEGTYETRASSYWVVQDESVSISVILPPGESAYVTIGAVDEDNYQINISLNDQNNDGEVTFIFNAYNAGTTNNTIRSTNSPDEISIVGDEISIAYPPIDSGEYPIHVYKERAGQSQDRSTLVIEDKDESTPIPGYTETAIFTVEQVDPPTSTATAAQVDTAEPTETSTGTNSGDEFSGFISRFLISILSTEALVALSTAVVVVLMTIAWNDSSDK